MTYNSRSNWLQQTFFSLCQQFRIASIQFLQSEQAQISVKRQRPTVLDVTMVMMVMMMSLELSVFVCHFNQNEFMFGEGMGGGSVMFVRVIWVSMLGMLCLWAHSYYELKLNYEINDYQKASSRIHLFSDICTLIYQIYEPSLSPC